jgi:hypothetical protein
MVILRKRKKWKWGILVKGKKKQDFLQTEELWWG